MRSLVDFIDAFMWQADPVTLRITFVSAGVLQLLGHPESLWLGDVEHWSENVVAADREKVFSCLRATASHGLDREVEFRAKSADGRVVVLRHAVRLLAGPDGKAELWGLTTDITADRRAEERYKALSAQASEFRRQALEDPLTGLPNRLLLDDRLGAALRAAQRSGDPCAVLLMDLDGFKEINDTRGHQAGDEVLRKVALVLRIALRAQDTPARLGGDEFAAVLPNTGRDGAVRSATRIIAALEDIGASIGIAIAPEHGSQAATLLDHADRAMYRTKANGGGFSVFASEGTASSRAVAGRRATGRRALGSTRRAMMGLAATLAILSGSMSQTALRPATGDASIMARLAAAAEALQSASIDEVDSVVIDVEEAVSSISWKDVSGHEVVSALDELSKTLGHLKENASHALAGKMNHLIETVQQAQVVATAAATLPEIVPPAPAPTFPPPEFPEPSPTP